MAIREPERVQIDDSALRNAIEFVQSETLTAMREGRYTDELSWRVMERELVMSLGGVGLPTALASGGKSRTA